MTSKAASDFEKYRLDVQITGDHTLQRGRDTAGLATWQKWRRGRSLGHGAFGEVHQQVWEDEHSDLHYRAVKVCLERTMQVREIDYKRELSTLAAFSNSEYSGFFVNLHGWWIESGSIFIAMEYLRYGDLSRYATTGISETEIKEITDNVLRGLEVMHHHGFTHRDIKPQNILVVQKRPEFSRWWVKIADFGISKQVLEGSNTGLYSTVGTADYCAPEIQQYVAQNEDTYTNKVDMWSLGCVLFNVSTRGHVPFPGLDLMKYCLGTIVFNPKNLPTYLNDDGVLFVKTLLQVQPEERPSAADALRHPWLTMAASMTTTDINSTILPDSHATSRPNFNSVPNPPPPTIPPWDPAQTNLTIRPAVATSSRVPPTTNEIIQQTSVGTRDVYMKKPSPPSRSSQPSPVRATQTDLTNGPAKFSSQSGLKQSGGPPHESFSRQQKSDVNVNETALINIPDVANEASQSTHVEVNKWLKENEAAIKYRGVLGATPLHFVAEHGQLQIATYLVQQGANINAKDKRDRTPLHDAAAGGHLELVKWLKGQGAYIHGKDSHGSAPIHIAAGNGHLEVVKWLKQRGVNINVEDNYRVTPAHCAAAENQLEVLKWLKEQGANVHAKNVEGKTPLDLAESRGHFMVVYWLREQRAGNTGWLQKLLQR